MGEIILNLIFISVWWLASLTVLLPFFLLLIINKTVRDTWFSFIFTKCIGPVFGPKTQRNRKKLFELLQEQYLTDRDKSVPLEILEIGIGGGANLQYYPENSVLTALDMNASFEKYFEANKKKHQHITYKQSVINKAEDMVDVDDSSFDIVVSTYVLCSVTDLQAVLKEVVRVLKKGGRFIFVDHVGFPDNEISHIPQAFAAPLWKVYCDGCCLNRNIRKEIEDSGFEGVYCEDIMMHDMPLLLRKQILGIATK